MINPHIPNNLQRNVPFNLQTKQLLGKRLLLNAVISTMPGIAIFILLPSALFWQANIEINYNI